MRMDTQPKPPSRILEAVHETAADLHGLGLIDGSRMQQYEELCQTPAQRLARKYAHGAPISDENGL